MFALTTESLKNLGLIPKVLGSVCQHQLVSIKIHLSVLALYPLSSTVSVQTAVEEHSNLRQQMREGPAFHSPVKPTVLPFHFIGTLRKQVDTFFAIVTEIVSYSTAVEALFTSSVASV